MSPRGHILSFSFDWGHVSRCFAEDGGVYSARSSSSSPSVVGVGDSGFSIGVFPTGGFFACGVAFFVGSVFSRSCTLAFLCVDRSSVSWRLVAVVVKMKGDLVSCCLCVGIDFGVGGFSGCLGVFGLHCGAF